MHPREGPRNRTGESKYLRELYSESCARDTTPPVNNHQFYISKSMNCPVLRCWFQPVDTGRNCSQCNRPNQKQHNGTELRKS